MRNMTGKSFCRWLGAIATSVAILFTGAGGAPAVTSVGADITADGVLTADGNVGLNDGVTGDAIDIGDAGDTVTILGDIAVTDAHWGVTAAGIVGFASIEGTPLGIVTTGVWNGTTIAIANGGTGATTLNDLIALTDQTTGNSVA